MNSRIPGIAIALVAAVLALATPAYSQGLTDVKKGEGGSVVKGSAGPSGSQGASDLEHCDKPMGAMAVVEPQDYVGRALSRYQLGSPVGLIRLMIQQSNCFLVVERGLGMRNMMQERALGDSGQLRQGSNMGGGQMVSADFVLTPVVVFSENNAGGVGGGLGAVGPLFGRGGRFVGAVGGGIAGGLKFKEAQTSMLVADARSGVQVSAAEGSTKKADLRLGAGLFGGGIGAAGGGYGNTNEGKIIAAAFMDNYNGVVRTVRNDSSLQRNVGTLKAEAAAGGTTKVGGGFNEGDVIVTKIANVRLLVQPSETAKPLTTLARGEELVVVGTEKDGYVNVQGAAGSGWVKTILVIKQ